MSGTTSAEPTAEVVSLVPRPVVRYVPREDAGDWVELWARGGWRADGPAEEVGSLPSGDVVLRFRLVASGPGADAPRMPLMAGWTPAPEHRAR